MKNPEVTIRVFGARAVEGPGRCTVVAFIPMVHPHGYVIEDGHGRRWCDELGFVEKAAAPLVKLFPTLDAAVECARSHNWLDWLPKRSSHAPKQ